MKPLFSEEYYVRNWDRFIAWVPGDNYIDLEKELEREMKTIRECGLSDSDICKVRRVFADKIAEKCKKIVMKEIETLKGIEAGRISFGYTTESQEIAARKEFRTRFDFNCLQLKYFKKKYLNS